MSQDMIMGVIRALLAAIGGGLVSKGYVDEATSNTIIGAVITLGTAAWSIAAKKKT